MRVFVVLFLILSSFLSIAQESTLTLPENEDFVKNARFQMVLDSDLQFVPDAEVPLNVFDEIGEFTQETSPKVIQTVFKLNDSYIWGALNAKNNTLNFFTF